MQTFISETISDIISKTTSFDHVVFILPSQRAGVFVKQAFKKNIVSGFLPEIINIQTFTTQVSGIHKVDSIQLLFHFYTVYKTLEQHPVTFDTFSSWAFTVLQDFNEIDQHLVATKDIFTYLKDINRLENWSVESDVKETPLMKTHHAFIEKLNEYYDTFYTFLKKRKIGYQGVLYREATKKIDLFLEKNSHKTYYFIGFNALNASEEVIVQKMLSYGNTDVYWDIDQSFLDDKHQAGNFIRRHKKQWPYYEKNDLKSVGNWFSKEKEIHLIGASKNITQIKHVGEILSTMPDFTKTALILADESLLPITLNSLPENVDSVNITMGYPLKNIPTTNVLFSIFQLFVSQEKLQKTNEGVFYYKDVIRFLKSPSIYRILDEENDALADEIVMQISRHNKMFVSQDYLLAFISNSNVKAQTIIRLIFSKYTTIHDFLDRILNLINRLKDVANDLEKEYLFRFYSIFIQLQNLQNEFQHFQDLKTLHQFFKQLISSESLSFQGEALQGLQLMGMLETRVLDFETVILTSVNEGILPGNNQPPSFIPFDVKVQFKLPTYREKDAIFAYHFFRLLQRAQKVYLLYNTESDAFGNGEKSRFVTQLELLKEKITSKVISPNVQTDQHTDVEIVKSNLVMQRLRELAEKGISPSALTNYLYNPLAFYKQKVLKLKEFDEVEEEVAFNTLGTVVHDTLEELYKPFLQVFLTTQIIALMEAKIVPLIQKYFKIHFKNGDIHTGKNRLIYEVAVRFVENFLKQEKTIVSNPNNRLRVLATEENYATTISVEGLDFPVKIHGQVDRIEELNGIIRIVDYKTGMVKSADLKVPDFTRINTFKYSKAIQVMLYAYMYSKSSNYKPKTVIEAGIYSFKNLKEGFLGMNFSSNSRQPVSEITEDVLEAFMTQIKGVISEIYNRDIPFTEVNDLPY